MFVFLLSGMARLIFLARSCSCSLALNLLLTGHFEKVSRKNLRSLAGSEFLIRPLKGGEIWREMCSIGVNQCDFVDELNVRRLRGKDILMNAF